MNISWLFLALLAWGFWKNREWLKNYWQNQFLPLMEAAWKLGDKKYKGDKNGQRRNGKPN